MTGKIAIRGSPLGNVTAMLMVGLLLFFFPLGVMAQTLHWSPESMFIEDIPIGATAYQTLTLTAADAPVSIDNLEWTYNQPGTFSGDPLFGFIADRGVPTVLAVGESMDIDISFTPEEEFSFASAMLLVTNNSLNAAALNYFVEGSCSVNACYPLSSCDGICLDTQFDMYNCGDCGVICTAPENASNATCENGNCLFTCNEGYELEDGACVVIIVDPPDPTLEESMADLLLLVDQSIADGTLEGFGPGKSSDDRMDVFMSWLDLADKFINQVNPVTGEPEPDLVAACDRLDRIHLRCDSGWPFVLPIDFVAGEAANEVHLKVLETMGTIEGCEASPAPTRP